MSKPWLQIYCQMRQSIGQSTQNRVQSSWPDHPAMIVSQTLWQSQRVACVGPRTRASQQIVPRAFQPRASAQEPKTALYGLWDIPTFRVEEQFLEALHLPAAGLPTGQASACVPRFLSILFPISTGQASADRYRSSVPGRGKPHLSSEAHRRSCRMYVYPCLSRANVPLATSSQILL